MCRMESSNNIRIYDKSNNLVGYKQSFDYMDTTKCYYNVSGNVLNRIHVNEDYSVNPPVYESVNSVIHYSDNIMLYPLQSDGEVKMEVITSGNTINFNNTPTISNRFDTYSNFASNSTDIEGFGLKSNLIDDYLNKL